MQDADGNRLVQIQVIHRHGARSPAYGIRFPSICGAPAYAPFRSFTPILPPDTKLHPSKPRHFSTDSAACYSGQLTPLGAAQMFALGARLRARYATLLPDSFDPRLVAVRSTAMRRTVESAVATLSGMFPVLPGEKRSVTIEVRPRVVENMLAYRRHCNKLYQLQMAAHASFTFPSALEDAQSSWLGLGERKTGSQTTTALRDIAVAMRENGLEPQKWEHVAEPLGITQILRMNAREAWGLALGRFVDELLQESGSHKTNEWRCKIYSGHDTTILPMMGCFEDKTIRNVPEFATDVVLETWVHPAKEDDPKIRLKYSGEDVVIAGCEQYGPLCPLSVVRNAVQKHIPDDLERACEGWYEPRTGLEPESADNKEQAATEGTTF